MYVFPCEVTILKHWSFSWYRNVSYKQQIPSKSYLLLAELKYHMWSQTKAIWASKHVTWFAQCCWDRVRSCFLEQGCEQGEFRISRLHRLLSNALVELFWGVVWKSFLGIELPSGQYHSLHGPFPILAKLDKKSDSRFCCRNDFHQF